MMFIFYVHHRKHTIGYVELVVSVKISNITLKQLDIRVRGQHTAGDWQCFSGYIDACQTAASE